MDADFEKMPEEQLLAVWQDWEKASNSRSLTWLRYARQCYRYAESNQVPEALRGQLSSAEGRMLWLSIVGLRYEMHGKVGTLMSEEPEPHFQGVEYGDDTGASVASSIVTHTLRSRHTRWHAIVRRAVWDQHVSGMGYTKEFRKDIRYELGNGQTAIGEVAAKRVAPELVRIDPMSQPGDAESVGFIIELDPVLLRDLKEEYGDKVAKVKGRVFSEDIQEALLKDYDAANTGARSDSSHDEFSKDPTSEAQGSLEFNQVVIVKRIWYVTKKRKPTVFEALKDGTYQKTDINPKDIPAAEKKFYRVIYEDERKVRAGVWVDDILLEGHEKSGETELEELPWGIFWGETIEGHHLAVGDVYHLLHQTNLINGLATSITDNAIRTAGAGWMYEQSALSTESKERLSNEGHLPGFNLEIKDGYFGRVSRSAPGQMSDSVYKLFQDFYGALWDKSTGRPEIQRGGMPYPTSGRGIIAMGQRADTANADWQVKVEEGITQMLRNRWRNIQLTYTFDMARRITGKIEGASAFNALLFRKDEQGKMQVIDPETQTPLLKDLNAAKFDMYATIRRGLPLTAEERRQQAIFLFEAHLVPEKWFVGSDGLDLKNGEELLAEAKQERAGYALLEKVQAALQKNPALMEVIDQPELLDELLDAATPVESQAPTEAPETLGLPVEVGTGGGNNVPMPGRMSAPPGMNIPPPGVPGGTLIF